MSDVLPGVLQTGLSEDHRSGKLLRQTDIENDSREGSSTVSVTSPATVVTDSFKGLSTSTPSRTNFSGCFPDDGQKKTISSSSTRKTTLIRGHALEGTSPPPESVATNGEVYNGQMSSETAEGQLNGQLHEAKDLLMASHKISNDSGNGTFDHTDESSDTSVLSRDSSVENASIRHVYKDSTNTNIPIFFRETIRRSSKDRKTVLLLEDQLLSFINNTSAQVHKTGELTSYDRMIVHRMAAFLGLEHNVDSTGKCVILSKTENTRSVRLSEVTVFEGTGYEPKKKILLKKPASFDEKHCRGNSKTHFGSHRAKSLEERQENYKVARQRIFRNDENQWQGGPDYNYKSFVPYHQQHQLQDNMKTNGHLTSKPGSTETSEHQNSSIQAHNGNNIKLNYQSNSHVPALVVTPTEHHQPTFGSAIDPGTSPAIQAQPHVNPDGSLYNFDPTCPPPFVVQLPTRPPLVTPPAASQALYQNVSQDNVSDVTTRFAATSFGSLDQGNDPFTIGLLNHPLPILIPQPQSVYTPVYPSQIMQGQYLVASAPTTTQPSVRYVAVPPQGQSQQVLQGSAMDSQGQVTVPMPPLGVPAMPGAGGFQVVGSPYQLTMAMGQPPHCVDMNSLAYNYGPAPETVMVAGNSGLSNSAPGRAAGTPQLFLALPQPVQQQAQFTPTGATPQGTYYSIPAAATTTPTPPLSISQPPPASHHQQPPPPPTVFFTSNIGNPLTYPVSVPDPSQASASSLKSVAMPFFQTQYISQHPKQQQLHPHHPQPVVISQNGHHPTPVTVNCNQPILFNPGQPLGPITAAQGPLLESVQNPYQVRPLGATVFHLAGNPVIQASHLGSNPHLQPYQFFRPAGTDVRLVNPSSVRPSLSPLQITSTSNPRTKYNSQYRQHKKYEKKMPGDVEGYQGPSPGQQTAHLNIIAPVNISSSAPLANPHVQPSSSRP